MSVEVDLNRSFALDRRHGIVQSQDWNNWRTVSTRNPEVVLFEKNSPLMSHELNASSMFFNVSTAAGWIIPKQGSRYASDIDGSNMVFNINARSTIVKTSVLESRGVLGSDTIEGNFIFNVVAKSTVVQGSVPVEDTYVPRTAADITTNFDFQITSKNVVVRASASETANTGRAAGNIQWGIEPFIITTSQG